MSTLGVPKPSKAARLLAQQAQRQIERRQRRAANVRWRYQNYGRVDGRESWPVVKARVLARDEHRCLMPRCDSPRLGVSVHHIVPVSLGGRSVEWNLASLCLVHHEANRLRERAFYYALLVERYPGRYPELEAGAA